MLKSIGHVKDAQLKALIDESDTPYISNHDYEASGELEPPAFASLQRRIYPEKQALTVEERKALVENDDLSKLKQSNQSQTTDSESASKKLEQTQPQCSSGENQWSEYATPGVQSKDMWSTILIIDRGHSSIDHQ